MNTSIRFLEGAHAEPPSQPGGEWRVKVAYAGSVSALDESGQFKMKVAMGEAAPGPLLVTFHAETVGDATLCHQLLSYANNKGPPPFWHLSPGGAMIIEAKVVRHEACTDPFVVVLSGVDTNKNSMMARA